MASAAAGIRTGVSGGSCVSAPQPAVRGRHHSRGKKAIPLPPRGFQNTGSAPAEGTAAPRARSVTRLFGPAPGGCGPLAPLGRRRGRAACAGGDWLQFWVGGAGGAAYKVAAPRISRFSPACRGSAPAPSAARTGARRSRVMATKAVCVLKGDGPVEGTIHFEQKASAGEDVRVAGLRSRPRPWGRPRHAPAAPGPGSEPAGSPRLPVPGRQLLSHRAGTAGRAPRGLPHGRTGAGRWAGGLLETREWLGDGPSGCPPSAL